MKPRIISSFLCGIFFTTGLLAQDRTTVTATNYDVSDNLDLKAVASIFGESRNLEDFEQRLNDPDLQISNLDLNSDNEVDYLRVIESAEGDTRLVIVQAVLDRDVYQDVATIEVERNGNDVQVQVVGDVYMYGPNYIYEPVYVTQPAFFSVWWGIGYRPYASSWYWGYYPSYWHVWTPMPVYRYRDHVHAHINVRNNYNYVNVRRSRTAVTLHNSRRADGYARRNPERSFTQRHANVSNRHELERTRRTSVAGNENTKKTRNANNVRGTRNNNNHKTTKNATRTKDYPTRSNPRANGTRNNVKASGTRGNTGTRSASSKSNTVKRDANKNSTRTTAPAANGRSGSNRENTVKKQSSVKRSDPGKRETNTQRSQSSRVEPAKTERQAPQQRTAPQAQRQSAPQQRQAPQQRSQGGAQRDGDGGGKSRGRD